MFGAGDIALMQSTQQGAMSDQCTLLIATSGSVGNAYGYPAQTFASSGSTACGLELMSTDENPNNEAAWYDARLRLPIGTAIDNLDRVQVTHRYGTALSPALDFVVLGNPMRGPSCLVLKLRTLTNG